MTLTAKEVGEALEWLWDMVGSDADRWDDDTQRTCDRHLAILKRLIDSRVLADFIHYWPILNEIFEGRETLRDPWQSAVEALQEAHRRLEGSE